MKKTILMLLCIMMILGLAACGMINDPKESDASAYDLPAIIVNTASDSEDMMKVDSSLFASENPKESESSTEHVSAIIANNVSDTKDMMKIDSPVGTLYYPEKWKDDISFQGGADQLVAMYYDIPLFTLYFGGKKGSLYGTVKNEGVDTELRYEMHDLDSDHVAYETMSVMQEDINIIFQMLIQEGKLTVAD